MAEGKCEKDATCDTCNQSSPIAPEEKESQAQGNLNSRLSQIKHHPRSCTIPEWIQRWALGS